MKALSHATFGLRLVLPRMPWLSAGSVMNERRRLAEMSDRELEDIGITRGDALREAGRPFWDVSPR